MPVPNLLNYAALVAMVPDYAGRGDPRFITRVPDFIALGEARIFRTLRTREMIVSTTLPIVAAANTSALPADFLDFARVSAPNQPRVEYMPADQLYDLPQPGDETRYTIDGLNLVYGIAAPAGGLSIAVRYYQHPGNLGTVLGGSTWLLQKNPQVYLYAALCEAALWAKNPSKAGEWGTLLDKEIDGLMSQDRAQQANAGRLRQAGQLYAGGNR